MNVSSKRKGNCAGLFNIGQSNSSMKRNGLTNSIGGRQNSAQCHFFYKKLITLDSGITVYYFGGFFPGAMSLLKRATYINYNFSYFLIVFLTLFPLAMYQIMCYFVQGLHLFNSRGYVYCFCNMFQGIRLFKGLRLFRSLE